MRYKDDVTLTVNGQEFEGEIVDLRRPGDSVQEVTVNLKD